ncbi:hypothetical protein LJC04_03925 [Ruminococcaceae bacterium OttesenSCG-928-O06]|nr:hypothetical protein [Ruminococcaceae bacterium OttesenSCG-928-O06]
MGQNGNWHDTEFFIVSACGEHNKRLPGNHRRLVALPKASIETQDTPAKQLLAKGLGG